MVEEQAKVEILSPMELVQAQTAGEIDIQISTAHRFPRSLDQFKKRALSMATLDQATAEACHYALPREGKIISGPSIRMAEIISSSYGNIRVAARIVSIDEKFVTVQGAAHDLETNYAATSEVKRRITKKSGQRYGDDMIVVTSNAACAIAIRNAVFMVVPRALFKTIEDEVRRVAGGDEATLPIRRVAALEYFKGLGIVAARVYATLKIKGVDDIDIEMLQVLSGIRTAIKDGEITADEAFSQADGTPAPLKAGRTRLAPTTAVPVAEVPAAQPADPAAAPVVDAPAEQPPADPQPWKMDGTKAFEIDTAAERRGWKPKAKNITLQAKIDMACQEVFGCKVYDIQDEATFLNVLDYFKTHGPDGKEIQQ